MSRILVALMLLTLTPASWPAEGAASAPPEQALIVHFKYGSRNLDRLFALEDKLEQAINKAGVGEYDGHEIAVDGSDGTLYMYGPNADKLFTVVRPILEKETFTKTARVELRYGSPAAGAKKKEVQLGT